MLGATLLGCTDHEPSDGAGSAAMTQDEKLSLVVGTGFPRSPQGFAGHIAGIPRLGIPELFLADGASGVANGSLDVTAFASGLNNAASFDIELVKRVGVAHGAEQAGKGHQIALAPTLNIARTPRNGRTFEGYGEDPYLAGEMASAYVQGVQSMGVIATPKHYAANNQETDRNGINVIAAERTLREIYYPAFEAAVTKGQAGSVMCSYNRLNGAYACENPSLLTEVLRGWGFDGFVMSDWWANQSTVAAANAGLDMEMPGDTIAAGSAEAHFSGGRLKSAIANGSVSEERLDEMVSRILRALERVGVLRKTYGARSADVSTPDHRALARESAAAGAVLLKNEGDVLPLTAEVGKVVVIGDDAGEHLQFGGFGSPQVLPSRPLTSAFAAIAARAPEGTRVTTAPGTLGIAGLPIIPGSAFAEPLEIQLYTSADGSGAADVVHADTLDLDALPPHDPPYLSAHVRGTLRVPSSGTYRFSLSGRGAATLRLDGELVAELAVSAEPVANAFVDLVEGTEVTLEVDDVDHPYSGFGPPGLHLGWQVTQNAMIAEAAAAAAEADVALVFASNWSAEGMDLATLGLPADQDQLIAAVAAANPRTIVVLHTAGPVLMPWLDRVAGVIEAWYPGEEGGSAIADVVFGDVNPSAKLPITFPATEARTPLATARQYPGVHGESGPEQEYSEGLLVGYRWYDSADETPLFAFGHGLSYTTFAYDELHVSAEEGDASDVTVSFNLKNSGSRAGAEIPQLYVGFPEAAGEPPRQLKAFQKVTLEPGASAEVTLTLDARAFSYWDEAAHGWRVAPGRYRLLVGSSSRDIRAETSYTVVSQL